MKYNHHNEKKKLLSGSLILGVLVLAQINLSNKESY